MCSLVLRIIDNKRPSLGADDAREEKISKKMKNDFKAKTSNFSVAGIPPFSHNSSQSFFPSSDPTFLLQKKQLTIRACESL